MFVCFVRKKKGVLFYNWNMNTFYESKPISYVPLLITYQKQAFVMYYYMFRVMQEVLLAILSWLDAKCCRRVFYEGDTSSRFQWPMIPESVDMKLGNSTSITLISH